MDGDLEAGRVDWHDGMGWRGVERVPARRRRGLGRCIRMRCSGVQWCFEAGPVDTNVEDVGNKSNFTVGKLTIARARPPCASNVHQSNTLLSAEWEWHKNVWTDVIALHVAMKTNRDGAAGSELINLWTVPEPCCYHTSHSSC